MPVKKEREYRTLVAPLAAQSSGEKRLQSECYVEGYATTFNAPYLLYEFEDGTKIYERIDAHALDSADMSDVIMQYDHEGRVFASSYAKTTEVTAAIANALTAYAKTADVTKAINAAVAGLIQLDDLSVASTGAGNVVTGLAYDNKTGKFTVTKGLTALTEADFTEITQQEVKAMFA